MADLKPCPFCGAVPKLGFKRTTTGDYCTLYADHEEDCFFWMLSDVAMAENHGVLISKWNKRRRTKDGYNRRSQLAGRDV